MQSNSGYNDATHCGMETRDHQGRYAAYPEWLMIFAIVPSTGKSGFPRECSTHLFHAPGCRGHCRFIVSVAT